MRGLFTRLKGVETTPLPASTPDITKAQVAGWLQFAASVAVGVGVLRPDEATVLIGASGLVAFGIHLGDAIIRNGRAKAVATIAAAGTALNDGFMGRNAPKGEEIPESPTLKGYDDGTGTAPPADALYDQAGDSSSAEEPQPVAQAVPTAEEVQAATEYAQQARQAAELARQRLDRLLSAGPPEPTRPLPDQQQ